MTQKEIEIPSFGFTFANEVTHKQVLLVDLLERVNLDIATKLAPAWISPLLKEEEKRRVFLNLLENAIETIVLIKSAQKHVAAIRTHVDIDAMDEYLGKIVDFSFIGFENPDKWKLVEPDPDVQADSFDDLHPFEITEDSLEEMLEIAKLTDDISVPLVWLQYNLELITTGMRTLKRQIHHHREATVLFFRGLTIEQLSELMVFLGADHVQGSHSNSFLRRQPSDLLIQ